MPISEEDRARLEKLGEARVRLQIKGVGFSLPFQISALEWLAERDDEARKRNEYSQSEQIDIARSAKDAAWEAARAARTANKIATAALIAAVIAIAVSIISLVRSQVP